MPEYPDVELYLHALRKLIVGRPVSNVLVRSPFVLRTFEIDISSLVGKSIADVSKIGKRIVWHLEDRTDGPDKRECQNDRTDFYVVFHLMITGRFHKKKAGTLPRSKIDLVAFHFPEFTLMMTETASKNELPFMSFRGPTS